MFPKKKQWSVFFRNMCMHCPIRYVEALKEGKRLNKLLLKLDFSLHPIDQLIFSYDRVFSTQVSHSDQVQPKLKAAKI